MTTDMPKEAWQDDAWLPSEPVDKAQILELADRLDKRRTDGITIVAGKPYTAIVPDVDCQAAAWWLRHFVGRMG